ncbi:HAMP domain-containing histidine kinase [Peptostreptococcus anaerobius]|uniref:histidine kinase n=3 Tax=Peptostreptococcus porci TaxID=2652282 RepID=A0A6N7XEX3_9FIRM|nr:HAMP domain-containing sensor histidine kinase [Peptostreptococcus porci]MDY4560787.1 HAMP domain-containing sensor histidine kinase [Peptostreptococcus porci]MST62143.1 HAMP domain-containing histidine kinase [Peptostreptococcus porci]
MINNNVFHKTRLKLIFMILLVVEIFMIGMSIFIYTYYKSNTYKTVDRSLLDEYHFISNQFDGDSILDKIILQDPKDIVYIYKGNTVKYYTQNRYFSDKYPTNGKIENGFYWEKFNGYNFRTIYFSENEYDFRIMRNIDSEKEGLSHMVALLIMTDMLAIIPGFFISKFLSNKALKPIENSWNNQVKFVQDASHELRTPVSIIQSKLEYLLKSPNSTIESEAETVAVAMRETRQLKKMISELLSLTKEESIVKINKEQFEIESVLKELSESYTEIAEYQNKVFSYGINTKSKYISTDRNKLTQLLRIFVDNAFKYTNEGDSIDVSIYDRGRDKVQIVVSDTGIGISEKDQKHIFERFFRSDSVRATDIEGSGIGLSISQIIIKTIGGTIKVKSKLGEGTKFFIEIPKGKIAKKL